MSVKTDKWIREQQEMIKPFQSEGERKGVVSYGASSMGYDFRLSDVFWAVNTPLLISPKDVPQGHYIETKTNQYPLYPGTTVLAKSLEYFQIPDDVLAIVYGKSTYARLGVLLNMTPIEPGWCGYLTMSISNLGRDVVYLHAYEGIGQMVFHQADEVPLATYATKQGKYQNAQGIMTARVEGGTDGTDKGLEGVGAQGG